MTLLFAAACTAAPVRAGSAAVREGPVRIGNAYLANIVSRALQGASERLSQPRCQQVFEQFSDQAGRRLAENLAALGEDGRSFLGRLFIYDAGGHDLCVSGRALAITWPGVRVVMVCGEPFRQAYVNDPALAEAVLIHEALHSLGLGENPPSSQEITARVRQLCGRRAS
jgi:hypothetical protein